MSDPQDFFPCRATPSGPARLPHDKPAWAEGIRALYDAVTEEALPAEFLTLLNQLGQLPKD